MPPIDKASIAIVQRSSALLVFTRLNFTSGNPHNQYHFKRFFKIISESDQNLKRLKIFLKQIIGLDKSESKSTHGSVKMAPRKRSFKHLLQWLIAGTRGGVNRARIINALSEEPRNANQLGDLLGVDYRTVRHHLEVLQKNGLVTSMGERYGKMYFLSLELEENFDLFEEIWNEIGKKLKKNQME